MCWEIEHFGICLKPQNFISKDSSYRKSSSLDLLSILHLYLYLVFIIHFINFTPNNFSKIYSFNYLSSPLFSLKDYNWFYVYLIWRLLWGSILRLCIVFHHSFKLFQVSLLQLTSLRDTPKFHHCFFIVLDFLTINISF